MTSDINPYAVPQSEPAAPPPQQTVELTKRRYLFTVSFAVLLLIGAPIAAAVALYDIESIVASGPILSVISIALAILSIRPALRSLVLISALTLVMSIGCFLTIYLNQWNPGQAQVPIGRATVVFAIVIQLGWFPLQSVRSGYRSANQWTAGA